MKTKDESYIYWGIFLVIISKFNYYPYVFENMSDHIYYGTIPLITLILNLTKMKQ